MNKILVISYNEGEQDFFESQLPDFFINLNFTPKIIIVCTQKSKSQVMLSIPGRRMLSSSNSTKHFQHVLSKFLISKEYKLLYKKDASFALPGITENNNIRTRIYELNNGNNIISNPIINKLSRNTVGLSQLSLNRQAIYNEITINGKKLILINTELASYNNGNLGLSDRQKEFMGLIKEFELHKKYNEGSNIIFCGSLNFKLNPIKIMNNSNKEELYKVLKDYIITKYESNNNNKLLEINELKVYINNLIERLHNKDNTAIENIIKNNNIIKSLKNTEQLYINLLTQFSDSIEKSGLKLTCDYNLNSKSYIVRHPLKMGSVSKNAFSIVSKGSFKPIENKLLSLENRQKLNFKIPSMCDKILFALHEDGPLKFEKFNVYSDLKTSKNRIIYSIFEF